MAFRYISSTLLAASIVTLFACTKAEPEPQPNVSAHLIDHARIFESSTKSEERVEAASAIAEDTDFTSLWYLVNALRKEKDPLLKHSLVAFLGNREASTNRRQADAERALIRWVLQDIVDASKDPTAELATDHLERLRHVQGSDGLVDIGELSEALSGKLGRPGIREFGGPRLTVTTPTVEEVSAGASPDSVRFVLLGDFGTCDGMQWKDGYLQCRSDELAPQAWVARAMDAFHRADPTKPFFHFGLTLGDNFYPFGLTGTRDERLQNNFEKRYGDLNINFHATLGNHDRDGGQGSLDAQIGFRNHFHMSAPYRALKVRDGALVQMFAIDSQELKEQGEQGIQMTWLKDALAKARTNEATKNAWRIVFGHHPIASGGDHGRSKNDDLSWYREKLGGEALANGAAHLYLAGHDHDMQLIQIGNLFQVIAGSAGKTRRVEKVDKARFKNAESAFCTAEHGFAGIEVTSVNSLKLMFVAVDKRGRSSRYECRIEKDNAGKLSRHCDSAQTLPNTCG